MISVAEIGRIVDDFFAVADGAIIAGLTKRKVASLRTTGLTSPEAILAVSIDLGLELAVEVHQGRLKPEQLADWPGAVFLLKYHSRMFREADQDHRKILWGSLRDGLSPGRDIRPFHSELAVAFSYTSYGCRVIPVDANKANPSRYEFDVFSGPERLEVEIKTCSFTSKLARGIGRELDKAFSQISRKNAAIVWIVVTDLPIRMHSEPWSTYDPVLSSPPVARKAREFIRKRHYQFPFSIAIAHDFVGVRFPPDSTNLFMPLKAKFIPGENFPLDHRVFMQTEAVER